MDCGKIVTKGWEVGSPDSDVWQKNVNKSRACTLVLTSWHKVAFKHTPRDIAKTKRELMELLIKLDSALDLTLISGVKAEIKRLWD